MTTQESFKRRVRERMAKTGERYVAARRVLLEQASRRGRVWISEPGASDEALRAATGRGWDEWCDTIDAWPGKGAGHAPIAAYLHEAHGITSWWAQTVTVGYERITGRRLPYQQGDGTFTISRSRTLALRAGDLRAMLVEPNARDDLFAGAPTELRSRATAKALRLAIGPGVATFALDAASGGRTKVTVAHEKLPSLEECERWRFYWGEWLDALADSDGVSRSVGAVCPSSPATTGEAPRGSGRER